MRFPDVADVLYSRLEEFGTPAFLTQPEIYDEDVSDLPAILIAVMDGEQRGVMHRTTYVSIIVADQGRDASTDVMDDIVNFLTAGPTPSPKGLIDSATCTTLPRDLPQGMDALWFTQADFAIETRGF